MLVLTVDLEKGINVSNSWYKLRNEGLKFCIKLYGLWRVAANMLKQLLHLFADLKVVILTGVIRSAAESMKAKLTVHKIIYHLILHVVVCNSMLLDSLNC